MVENWNGDTGENQGDLHWPVPHGLSVTPSQFAYSIWSSNFLVDVFLLQKNRMSATVPKGELAPPTQRRHREK